MGKGGGEIAKISVDYKPSSHAIDEQDNVIVQFFNIIPETVNADKRGFEQFVREAYNKLISALSAYVNFSSLHLS